MSVEIIEIETPIGNDTFMTLYVVRLTRRLGGMLVKAHDYNAYKSYDMAMAVKTAIESGNIVIGLTF